jgi:hypothetical protein
VISPDAEGARLPQQTEAPIEVWLREGGGVDVVPDRGDRIDPYAIEVCERLLQLGTGPMHVADQAKSLHEGSN